MIEQEVKALAAEEDWQSILDSPEYFLDAIDLQNELFKDRNLGGLPPSKTIALENPGWPEANQIGLKLSRLRPSSRFEGFFLTKPLEKPFQLVLF